MGIIDTQVFMGHLSWELSCFGSPLIFKVFYCERINEICSPFEEYFTYKKLYLSGFVIKNIWDVLL